MWKLKRMNTEPIVVMASDGAGGIAAYLANGSDNKPPQTDPVAKFPALDAHMAVLSGGILTPSLTETLK